MTPQERLGAAIAADRETRANWRCAAVQVRQYEVKPFVVSGVEITVDNMDEVAEWCRGQVDRDPGIFPGTELERPPHIEIVKRIGFDGTEIPPADVDFRAKPGDTNYPPFVHHIERQVGYVNDMVVMNPDKTFAIIKRADFDEKFQRRRDTIIHNSPPLGADYGWV